MTVRVKIKGIAITMSDKLEQNLIKLASKYHPEGELELYPARGTSDLQRVIYVPDGVITPILISTEGDEIVDITGLSEEGVNPHPRLIKFMEVFKKAQARVLEKQKVAEKQAPVKKGIEVLNHVEYLQPKDIDTIRKVASMYYPSGCIDIRDLGNRGHLVNVFDTGNPQYGTVKFYSHYSTLGALDVGLPNETDPKIIEHKKAFIDAYNKFKLDAYSESKQKVEPDTVLSVAPAPVQQAQPIPKNYRRIDSTKRKLYFVEGQFYPPYDPVMVAIGDSPKNSEVYTEDGQKLYLGVNRYKLLQQSHRAGLRVTSINPKNGGSQKALQYFKIELV